MINLTYAPLIIFIASLVISAIIIHIVTKMFDQKQGFGIAILTALIGAIIYAVTYYYLRPEYGLIASIIGGMPAWKGALSEHDIWGLVNFIQSLGEHPHSN